jgi:class 3 adenylate cyclase
MGDYSEASNRFYDALHWSEKKQIHEQMAYANNNIGDIFRAQKNFKEALPYAQKALQMFEQLKDIRGVGFAQVRLGEIYQGLKEYEKSIEAFEKSLEIRLKLGDKTTIVTSYTRMGVVYALKKDYEKAITYHEKAYQIGEEMNAPRVMAGALDNLASVYISQKKYGQAKEYALKSLAIAQKLHAKGDERNVYATLARLSEEKGDFRDALAYTQKYLKLHDSIDNTEKSNQLAKMQAIYDTKKKEQENTLLKREKELKDRKEVEKDFLLAVSIGAFLLTLGGIYLVFRSRQKQVKLNAKIKIQNEALLQLSKNAGVQRGDWDEALQHITQTVAQTLRLERVSVWSLEALPAPHIHCLQLFELEEARFSKGVQLFAHDFPVYFEVIQKQHLINAQDARHNAHTKEFAESYLIPLQIFTMLDIPIFSESGLWGVICCEVKYKKRTWREHEISFLKSVADIITIAHKSFQRKVAEQELARKKQKLERNISTLLAISKNEAIANGDWQVMAREVTKAIVHALQTTSSQLWYYNFKEDTFYCLGNEGENFQLLSSFQVPIFHTVLQEENAFIVPNIDEDARIDAQSKAFFAEHHTQAVIIYPNVLSDKQKGVLVVCQDAPKQWDMEDLAFMKSMEDEIVIAYQGYRRKQAQDKIEKQNKEIAEKNESLRTTLRLVKQEQKRTDELLLNILPFEIAEELKAVGQATPHHYPLVTVLFTDFSGFTKIVEKLTPQEVIAELDTCFLAFDEICEKHNLEKIKTIGDSYMCAGGIPIANQTNPVDAIHAALEMCAWMKQWQAEKRAVGKPAWEIRLGIHSGEVVAGIIGKKKFAYDIWGDAVNLASRMESGGEVGKINISGATYALVKDKFHCVFRGKIQAKNKGEVEMYFVEGVV